MTEPMTENNRRSYNRWSDDEVQTLRDNASAGVSALASMLNRSKPNIYQKARQLGIEVRLTKKTTDSI